MALDETDKYLGLEEGEVIDNSQMKESLLKEYYHWVQQIFKTAKLEEQDHSYQHLCCTSPSLQLGNSQLVRKEIEKIDKKIHHPKADINRLYIKRQNDGHGLVGGVCIYCCYGWSQPLY
jgi:hypothetical protein